MFYNGTKYLILANDNNLKSLSLEDNVYFTLQDIFLNMTETYEVLDINNLNKRLKDDVSDYTDVLNDTQYLIELNMFLKSINESNFQFKQHTYNINELIKFGTWYENFVNLKQLIELRINELNIQLRIDELNTQLRIDELNIQSRIDDLDV